VGPAFEQWVILQLLYLNHAGRHGWRFSSYRSERGAEVDLVIDTGSELIGIDVKAGRTVSPSDTRGLVSLAQVAGGRKPFRPRIVFRGPRRQRFENGVEAVPVLEALAELSPTA
jgi:predicted AAA+ superfamily ATPase